MPVLTAVSGKSAATVSSCVRTLFVSRAFQPATTRVFCAVTAAASGMVRTLPELGSGAVIVGNLGLLCALLAAFGHLCRGEKVRLLLAPAPIRVPHLVIGVLVILLLLNLRPAANVLWLSGAAFGLLYADLATRAGQLRLGRLEPRPDTDRFGDIDLGE